MLIVTSQDFLDRYVQNELLVCDFLEQQAKINYDFEVYMIRSRRDSAKQLQKELTTKKGDPLIRPIE